ncbi:DUF899 family protein [Sphingobium sp. H39-3-25]|uniref:DUF899 family protein n=1 Tax=Sphingobium arseniciresistens TaxID=3030834 RepID=UPI0023B92D15|nr:DUF899 family protein [Sphingobium arseniciresistens]
MLFEQNLSDASAVDHRNPQFSAIAARARSNRQCGDFHSQRLCEECGRGDIFHSYSTYHRGTELLMGAFNWLDLTPKGRNETRGIMSWVKLHDQN